MVHIILASKGYYTSPVNQTFFFLLSFLLSLINEYNNKSSSSPSMAFLLSQIIDTGHFSMPDNPYSYVPSDRNGSTLLQIFNFFIHIFLFSYYFHLFHFYFQGISYCQVCGHTFHITSTTSYIAYYKPPILFLFQFFLRFYFEFLCTCQGIIPSWCEAIFKPIKDNIIFFDKLFRHKILIWYTTFWLNCLTNLILYSFCWGLHLPQVHSHILPA